ncbi:MAG TPA: helix-turn-helix transcriptional regulator [Candidatus Saccharimonadales bacterium]|nr:helix-turn-helix transcriptional regulator [Candidatus Saccharimonadales bacterium]
MQQTADRFVRFGVRLKKRREREGFTRGDLSYSIGYSEAYIANVEEERITIPNMEFVQRVSKLFGWKIEDLLFVMYQRS